MNEFYKRYKPVIRGIFTAAGFIAFIFIFRYLFSYAAPFIFGFLLSLALNPIARFLEKKLNIWRGIAAIISLMVFIALIGSIGTGIAVRINNEARSFLSGLSAFLNGISENYEALKSSYLHIASFAPPGFEDAVDSVMLSLAASLAQSLGSGLSSTTGSLVSIIPNFLMSLLLSFISAFFFIKDRELIICFLSKYTPERIKEKYSLIKRRALNALTGYIKAQLFLMLITLAICTAGLLMLRYPYALFMGLIIAAVDVLPFFGAGFIIWPWAAASFLSQNHAFGTSLLAIYLSVVLSRQIMEPRVRQIGIHPLVILISVYVGFKIFGALGFFLGPAAAVTAKVFMDIRKMD